MKLSDVQSKALSELDGATIDCSLFTPVRGIGELKVVESGDGLRHILEFHGRDGTAYQGPTPYMVERNICGFLQRENGIADAKRSGYRWKRSE